MTFFFVSNIYIFICAALLIGFTAGMSLEFGMKGLFQGRKEFETQGTQ